MNRSPRWWLWDVVPCPSTKDESDCLSADTIPSSKLRLAYAGVRASNLGHSFRRQPRHRASLSIDTVRNWFQVCRVHARPNTADVIKFGTFWDRPNQRLINGKVGAHPTSAVPPTTVSPAIERPGPNPAPAVGINPISVQSVLSPGMPREKSHGLTFYPSPISAVMRGQSRWLATTTLTKSDRNGIFGKHSADLLVRSVGAVAGAFAAPPAVCVA